MWTYFSNQGAARFGLTPIWFNHTKPSGAVSRPSRITRKSYGPRVPNRTMVATFDHVLVCWFRNQQASLRTGNENRREKNPQIAGP